MPDKDNAGSSTEQPEQQSFEIPEQEETRKTEESNEIDLEGADPREVEMAEKHGFKTKEEEHKDQEKSEDGEHKEQPKTKTPEDTEKQAEEGAKEEKVEDKTPTLEEVESNEALVDKYNPNEKALYWKWKNDKKKRQDAQKERDDLKAQIDLDSIKGNVSGRKLAEITQALGKEDLTIEMIQKIIDNQQDVESDDKPITKADLNKIEEDKKKATDLKADKQSKFGERILTTENIGKSKYKNFDDIVKLAQEVVSEDKAGTYQEILATAFSDEEMDEEVLIERVVTIAKLSPKYKELDKSVKPEDKAKVEKAIENSKKKISSAAIGTSGSKRVVNEDELTSDDAARFTTTQWQKLKPETKKRLLGG